MFIPTLLAHAGEGGFWSLFLQLPPLHPVLVNVTAGLIPAAVAFDIAGRMTRRESLASAGFWMILLAAAVTPFTALAGWFWMDEMGQSTAMTVHKWLGIGIAVAVVALAGWRLSERRRETRPDARPGAGYAYLSVAAVFVLSLIFQGHIGGMMSFGSVAAVAEHDEGGEPVTTQPADDGWKAAIQIGGDEAIKPHHEGQDHAD